MRHRAEPQRGAMMLRRSYTYGDRPRGLVFLAYGATRAPVRADAETLAEHDALTRSRTWAALFAIPPAPSASVHRRRPVRVRRALAAGAPPRSSAAGAWRPARSRPTAPSLGPTAAPPAVAGARRGGAPIAGLRCSRAEQGRFGVHLELFAARRVVLVAPGIGVAPPRTRRGAYVTRRPLLVSRAHARAHRRGRGRARVPA